MVNVGGIRIQYVSVMAVKAALARTTTMTTYGTALGTLNEAEDCEDESKRRRPEEA